MQSKLRNSAAAAKSITPTNTNTPTNTATPTKSNTSTNTNKPADTTPTHHQHAIYIFTRALRVFDNRGLIEALRHAETVYPIFIFDPKQTRGAYFSQSCFDFLVYSLQELREKIPISFYVGDPVTILKRIKRQIKFTAVYLCADYTPYAIERQTQLSDAFPSMIFPVKDIALNSPMDVKPYKKFTPYYAHCKSLPVAIPVKPRARNKDHFQLVDKKHSQIPEQFKPTNIIARDLAGRDKALKILRDIPLFKKYGVHRNDPNLPTTRLSVYMKFGIVSVREVYYAVRDNEPLLREIYFRDFYLQSTHHFGKSPNPAYDQIPWLNNPAHFTAWCTGLTGVPFVDAGMRQLNTIHWMHNRLRMITASFLVKNLLLDWHLGERYFATKLIDYDYSSNLGGWLFTTGALDGSPYYRVFNPMSQGREHDPDAKYIKTYIPELADVPAEYIHRWDEAAIRKQARAEYPKLKYPDPIVSVHDTRERAIKHYQRALYSK